MCETVTRFVHKSVQSWRKIYPLKKKQNKKNLNFVLMLLIMQKKIHNGECDILMFSQNASGGLKASTARVSAAFLSIATRILSSLSSVNLSST